MRNPTGKRTVALLPAARPAPLGRFETFKPEDAAACPMTIKGAATVNAVPWWACMGSFLACLTEATSTTHNASHTVTILPQSIERKVSCDEIPKGPDRQSCPQSDQSVGDQIISRPCAAQLFWRTSCRLSLLRRDRVNSDMSQNAIASVPMPTLLHPHHTEVSCHCETRGWRHHKRTLRRFSHAPAARPHTLANLR